MEEIREVSLQKAESILKDVGADPFRRQIIDAQTGEEIWEIRPSVKDILIVPDLAGGG
jgi:hypothetical protein